MGGVPNSSSVPRAVRLLHYIIFIKTRRLLLLRLRLVLPPTLIYKTYNQLLPTAHGIRGAWPPLLHQYNVKDHPCINVLGHTVVLSGDVLPNDLHTHVQQRLSNGEGANIFRSGTGASGQRYAAPPNYTGSPTPAGCRVLQLDVYLHERVIRIGDPFYTRYVL